MTITLVELTARYYACLRLKDPDEWLSLAELYEAEGYENQAQHCREKAHEAEAEI